jgi:hypothetical protein
MDVFKYLKKARQISEEKQPSLAQMQAQKLGLRNIKFGHYIDDRTGERYEVRNGKLEKVLDKEPAADKATEKGPKNFAQMRKDADAAAQQSMDLESELADPQSNRRVPGGPSAQAMDDGDVEQVAIMLSRGRWDVMDPAMKQKKREEARELIARREEEKALAAQMAAQAEEDAAAADEEEAAQPEPEPEEKQENPPITLDQALLDADEDEDTADPELAAKADVIMKDIRDEDDMPAGLDSLLGAIRSGKEDRIDKSVAKVKAQVAKKQPKKVTKTPKPVTDRVAPPKGSDRTDVPQFKSEGLQQLNPYLSENKQREEDDYYTSAAKDAVREQQSEAFYYFDEPNGVETNINTPQGASDLMDWSTNNANKLIGKSLKPFWKEVVNFHNNWADPKLRDENNYEEIIDITRPNRGKITDEIVDEEWSKLKNSDKKQLAEMGLGGAGGRANHFLKTDADRVKRGKAILKVYLEQGGRDAWLGSEDTNPISWKDMTVDHVHSEGDTKFWQEQAKARGMDPADYQQLANDPDVNYVMTRFGFNGAQKRDNSMDKLYQEMDKKYYTKGKDEVDSLTRGNAEKKMRKQLREQEYYGPIVQTLKSMVQSGNFTPEVYNELFDNYKNGRAQLESENGPRTDRSQMIMGRNESTDPWRSLAERTLVGYKIFAGDGLRAKKGGQIAGWSGVGGTTSGSNAADGEAPSYPYEDSALDFYFDPIRRLALSSPENQAKADAIHKYTQFMGNAFVTGKIGSQEWQNYLSSSSQMMHDMLPDEWKGEFDSDRADEYLTTINRTLNKLNKSKADTRGDNYAPDRNITELFKNSPQRSLAEQGIEVMRSLMNPEKFNAVDYYDRGNLYESAEESTIKDGRAIIESLKKSLKNEV